MKTKHRIPRRSFAFLGAMIVVTGAGVPFASRATQDGKTPYPSTPDATPHATPIDANVAIVGFSIDLKFDPQDLVIAAGTTVTWENTSSMPHTATGDPEQNPVAEAFPDYIQLPNDAEPWGSELLNPGEDYSHTFETPGEYRYICIPHVMSGMRGTITVEG